MNISTLILILKRQFFTKWGRFLLASGGIMIGVWAITLTTSLSLGLSEAIVTAINSQPAAKSFTIGKDKNGLTDFFSATQAPEFIGIGKSEIKEIKDDNKNIVDVQPNITAANNFLNLAVKYGDSPISCFELNKGSNRQSPLPESDVIIGISNETPEVSNESSDFSDNCSDLTISSFIFDQIYEENKKNWVGDTSKPEINEIVLCYNCNDLGKKLGADKPEDLLGREVEIDYLNSPINYVPGEFFDVFNSSFGVEELETSKTNTFTVSAVVDDDGGAFGTSVAYLDSSYFDEAILLKNPDLADEEIGYFQLDGYLNSYDNLDATIENLQNDGYLSFSFVQIIITGISTFFTILTYVLSSLGIIAIIASIFGIINVMTISVLERKKEIGILKSLGSKDGDILKIFMIESASLGVIGWILGFLLAMGTGFLLTSVLNFVINLNDSWKESLENFGISSFAPTFPWWLVVGTLLLAVTATVISGLIPAIKASRQNPIDVLRSE